MQAFSKMLFTAAVAATLAACGGVGPNCSGQNNYWCAIGGVETPAPANDANAPARIQVASK